MSYPSVVERVFLQLADGYCLLSEDLGRHATALPSMSRINLVKHALIRAPEIR